MMIRIVYRNKNTILFHFIFTENSDSRDVTNKTLRSFPPKQRLTGRSDSLILSLGAPFLSKMYILPTPKYKFPSLSTAEPNSPTKNCAMSAVLYHAGFPCISSEMICPLMIRFSKWIFFTLRSSLYPVIMESSAFSPV